MKNLPLSKQIVIIAMWSIPVILTCVFKSPIFLPGLFFAWLFTKNQDNDANPPKNKDKNIVDAEYEEVK